MSGLRLHTLPPGLATLADREAQARQTLDAATWAYFNSGSAHETTLAANLRAWDAIALLPRVLRRLEGGHTRTSLFGREMAAPLMLAPVALQRLAHPDGELASAHAAAAHGAGFVLGTQASVTLEAVAKACVPSRGAARCGSSCMSSASARPRGTWSRAPRRPAMKPWSSPSTRRCRPRATRNRARAFASRRAWP